MRLTVASAITAVFLCFATSAAAGQDARLKPGAQIRFQLDASDTLHVGQVARITRDSLILRLCRTCSHLQYSKAEVHDLAVFSPTTDGLPHGVPVGSGFFD